MEKKYKLQKSNLGYRIKVGSATFLMLITSMIATSCKKHKPNVEPTTIMEEETLETPNLDFMTPQELGLPLENLKTENFIEILSGDFDINQVVRDLNGTLWASQDDLNNSKNIGKVIINTNGGQYTITKDSNGNTIVKENGVGYQIIDKNGNIKESGNGIPAGYKEIEGSQDLIVKEYTIADKDYYNNKGEVVISKGSVISVETESRANAELATSKKEAEERASTTKVYAEEITSSNEQIIQELIRQGVSEEDARRAVSGSESTTKKSEPTTEAEEPTTKAEEPTTKKSEPTTKVEEPTTKKSEPTTKAEEPVTKAQSSGYYEIYGMKFLSEADYQQWVFQGYTGYSEVNGVMRADTKEMDEAYQKSLGGN